MFKSVVVAFTCLSTMACLAQNPEPTVGFKKGDYALSGSVGFSTSKSEFESPFLDNVTGIEEQKSYRYNFNPAVRHFVTDHIALGIEGTIGYGKSEQDEQNFEASSNNWSAGAFGSYYFTPQKKFSFLTTLGVSFGSRENSTTFLNSNTDFMTTNRNELKDVSFSLSAGLNYFISPHFALRTNLGVLSYTRTTSEDVRNSNGDISTLESKSNNFFLSSALEAINVGLLYRI